MTFFNSYCNLLRLGKTNKQKNNKDGKGKFFTNLFWVDCLSLLLN